MTSPQLIDNTMNLQDLKTTVRHFSSCRKKMETLNGHLFQIVKKQKKAEKNIFTLRFIPELSVFDIDSPARSVMPLSYLVDTVRELLDIMLQNDIQLQVVSNMKSHCPINPFEEKEWSVIITEQEEKHPNRRVFSVHIKGEKRLYFEVFFSISI